MIEDIIMMIEDIIMIIENKISTTIIEDKIKNMTNKMLSFVF